MLGTNTDPYQRAEGRYRLMPGIIQALTDAGTPFSILTKGTLLRRDLPLLTEASREVDISLAMSIAVFDDALQRTLEPGTPSAGLTGSFWYPSGTWATAVAVSVVRRARDMACAGRIMWQYKGLEYMLRWIGPGFAVRRWRGTAWAAAWAAGRC